ARPLPSIPSAADASALFGDFVGTTGLSDCLGPFIVGVCPWTSRRGPPPHQRRAIRGSPGSRARCFRTCSGSLTARSLGASCVGDAPSVAFRFSLQRRQATHRVWPSASPYSVGAPERDFAAEYPACTFPCQRFTLVLAD